MSKAYLRNFNIFNDVDISHLTEDQIAFHNSNLFKRGTSKIHLFNYIESIQEIFEKRKKSGIKYKPIEFGDINKTFLDPSVRFALLSVGTKLIEKQCLTPTELTYFFIKWRFDFLMSCDFDRQFTQEYIDASQYTEIKDKYKEYASLFEKTTDSNNDTVSIERVCQANDKLFRKALKQAERYCYEYLNVILIPTPSQFGENNSISSY